MGSGERGEIWCEEQTCWRDHGNLFAWDEGRREGEFKVLLGFTSQVEAGRMLWSLLGMESQEGELAGVQQERCAALSLRTPRFDSAQRLHLLTGD